MEISREYVIVLNPVLIPFLIPTQPKILVDAAGRARIAHFGLAAVTQSLDSMGSTSGYQDHTARWTAPEILDGWGACS